MRRVALALVPLPGVFLLGASVSATFADAAGSALAAALGEVSRVVALHETASESDAAPEHEAETPAVIPAAVASPAPSQAAKRSVPSRKAPATPRVVFVSAHTVLRLAETRAEPRARYVKGDGVRPPGLRLSGVGALGIGLADGDVLVRALGVPAASKSEVVSAVISARARRVRVLEGEVWRGRERFVLRVEQPYLADP